MSSTHTSRTFSSLIIALCAFALGFISPIALAQHCGETGKRHFEDVMACYRLNNGSIARKDPQRGIDTIQLYYKPLATTPISIGIKKTFALESQLWMSHMVSPGTWTHRVDVYIPNNALHARALLVINNGIGTGTPTIPAAEPTDFPEPVLLAIAETTRTIVVSVNNAPNQFLTYSDQPTPLKEDDSVAHSWKLFLSAPDQNSYVSLHIPTMDVASRTMDLLERELAEFGVHHFVVTGASKRGWAAWHTALVDERVEAIVPFVFDGLDTREMLKHTYRVYGQHWPLALKSYVSAGIMEQLNTQAFTQLMQIEDPMQYLRTQYSSRLQIPKYIVNASGDDFFVPDNAKLYFDRLPGDKVLRVAPNTNHYGIKAFTQQSLTAFLGRFQSGKALPRLTVEIGPHGTGSRLHLHFSEVPREVKLWTASNANSRDFRFACGVRYIETSVEVDAEQKAVADIPKPETGWTASFIEAQFADGFVATSRVFVTPDEVYPMQAPPSGGPGCDTLDTAK